MSETHAPEKLQRKLGARHLNMIAIGGSIGTGLFLASGSTIANAGPGGALLAYSLIGIMIYFLMTSLGELATHTPTSGAFFTYGSRYVEEGFGFALGWNYWYNWAITVAFELVAVQFIMKFWFPDIPGFYWSALFLVIIFMLNAMSGKGFVESEFWFSMVKVIAIVAFIIIGIAMIIKVMLTPGVATFGNWTYKDAPFVGGLQAMIGVAMIAGFSFQGTEMVGVAAGESKDPKKTMPLAIKQIFWRILLFYVLCIFIIGTLIAYDDPNLLQAATTENVALSPFTLLYEKVGFAFAASLMNAVILTAILSAGNSGMYSSTRMLFDMAQQGRAPKWFAKLDNRGVPMNALYAISHYRFRKGYIAQGYKLEDLAYRAKFFPFAPWFAFILCSVIILGQNYQAVLGGKIDWMGLLSTYISLPLFLVIWLGYKWKNKTKLIPYDQMDVKPEQD